MCVCVWCGPSLLFLPISYCLTMKNEIISINNPFNTIDLIDRQIDLIDQFNLFSHWIHLQTDNNREKTLESIFCINLKFVRNNNNTWTHDIQWSIREKMPYYQRNFFFDLIFIHKCIFFFHSTYSEQFEEKIHEFFFVLLVQND